MAWRNLAYGSQRAADSAPVVAPLRQEQQPTVPLDSVPKSTGGKIYRILEFLRLVPNHTPATQMEIFARTGIDLSMDEAVDERLKNNPKVVVADEKYAYQVSQPALNMTTPTQCKFSSPNTM